MTVGKKIISFVSYKGGAGRSVTLANVAFQLAKNYRVGCIDLDIEAGSLHKVFNIGDTGKHSIQHFLTGPLDQSEEEELLKYLGLPKLPDYYIEKTFKDWLVIDLKLLSDLKNVKKDIKDLYLIQAKPDAGMTAFVDAGSGLFQNVHNLIELFAKYMKLDFVLVDCRSGISNIGLPGFYYSNLAVVCMRWGTQHRYGTTELVKWFDSRLFQDKRNAKIILVPSSINPELVSELAINSYIHNELQDIPTTYVTIPIIPGLANNDEIFWRKDSIDYQEPFIRLKDQLLEIMELKP